MKYSEHYQKPKFKGSYGFYILIACCLIAVGGASWFAASNIKHRENIQNNPNSQTPPVVETPSTEENNVLEAPSIDVTEPVDNEPYTEETPQVQETVKQVFVMPVQGEIIKPYSEKELQYSATFGDMRVHLGIDIACENGTSVSSCSNGKILNIEDNSQLGTTITIDHGNGITAKYAGLNEIKFKVGDTVSAGDIIGEVSTIPTECADQSHFHFEVYKNGHPSSPLETLHIN